MGRCEDDIRGPAPGKLYVIALSDGGPTVSLDCPAGPGAASAAAAGGLAAAGTAADQQVTSKQQPIARQRSRLWNAAGSIGEVDSLQNAVDAFKVRHPHLA